MARKKKGDVVDGWVCLDKPFEMGSTEAVSRIRRLFNAQKAGHAGTLDPLASGILPIALGEATKTVPMMMEAKKVYRFTINWGVSTDSVDREGEIIARCEGRALELIRFCHPFYERFSPVYLADYVETGAGTGIVHSAPAYGEDDFRSCKHYGMENDDILSPVQSNGVYVPDLPFFGGQFIWKANPAIVAKLEEVQRELLAGGLTASTPVAMIENASTPNQRQHACQLSQLCAAASAFKLKSPAVLVIGEVVNAAELIQSHSEPSQLTG